MRADKTDGWSRPIAGTLLLTLSAVVLVFGVAGCGGKNNNAAPTASPGASPTSTSSTPSTTSTGAQFDIGNTITYKDGNPKVENLGSGNTINKAG